MSRSLSSSLLLPLGAALILGGCVTLPVETDKLGPQVDIWVAEKEYDKAIDALTQVDPKHPDYPQLSERRKEVEKLAAEYERQVIAQAIKLSDKGKWADALGLYDKALGQLADSAALRDGLADLHTRQQAALDEQNLKLLLHEARWLEAALPVKRGIIAIVPRDDDITYELQEMEERARGVAARLVDRGLAALKAEDARLAGECLPLALKLDDGEATRAAAKALEDYHSERKQQRQAARDAARQRELESQRRYDTLLSSYRQHFKAKRYVQARDVLAELKKERPNERALRDEERKLEEAISRSIAAHLKAGSDAYSLSQFEKAHEHWSAVLRLDPEHKKARENLQRVERVLENLRKLRERQGG